MPAQGGPFTCGVCLREYPFRSYLVRHLGRASLCSQEKLKKGEHRQVAVRCGVCDASFRRLARLNGHMRMFHASGGSGPDP